MRVAWRGHAAKTMDVCHLKRPAPLTICTRKPPLSCGALSDSAVGSKAIAVTSLGRHGSSEDAGGLAGNRSPVRRDRPHRRQCRPAASQRLSCMVNVSGGRLIMYVPRPTVSVSPATSWNRPFRNIGVASRGESDFRAASIQTKTYGGDGKSIARRACPAWRAAC